MKKILLKLLNWTNKTPAKYGFVNNVENFSLEFLESSARQEPDITLSEFMKEMKAFAQCKEGILENGICRPWTEQDIKDLQDDFQKEVDMNEIRKRQKNLLK